jgi:hypothetical protein
VESETAPHRCSNPAISLHGLRLGNGLALSDERERNNMPSDNTALLLSTRVLCNIQIDEVICATEYMFTRRDVLCTC